MMRKRLFWCGLFLLGSTIFVFLYFVVYNIFLNVLYLEKGSVAEKKIGKEVSLRYIYEEIPEGINILAILRHDYIDGLCNSAIFIIDPIRRELFLRDRHFPKWMPDNNAPRLTFGKLRKWRDVNFYSVEYIKNIHNYMTIDEAYTVKFAFNCNAGVDIFYFLMDNCFRLKDCLYFYLSENKKKVIIVNVEFNIMVYSER